MQSETQTAEVVWRRLAVNRPTYGCAIAEGKSAFCYKNVFRKRLGSSGRKKVGNEIETAIWEGHRLMKERGPKTLALIPLNLDGHLFGNKKKNGKAQ